MSLLLDALHRASKDKERAAGAALKLSEEPGLAAASAPTPAAAEPAPAPAAKGPAPKDLALAPLHPEPEPEPPPAASPAPAAQAEVAPPVPPAKTPVAPAARTAPASTPPARPAVDSPRMARDLLSAHAAAPKSGPRPSVLILGAVALVLAVGLGSLMLGFWDPHFQTTAPVGTLPPAATVAESSAVSAPASAATPAPAASASVPVAASAHAPGHTRATASMPAATAASAAVALTTPPAGAASAPRATGRRTGAGGASPAPQFVARTTGPGALEDAYAALTAGRMDEATRMYGDVLKAQPEERDALLGMAYIAHRAGRRDEAAAYYQRVLRQEPDHPVALSGLLALQAKTDPAQATSRARDVVERHPESAAALAALGHLLVKEGRLADASQAFARAQALEPGNAAHAYNLAVALDRLHQYDKARGQYERALALSATTATPEPGFSRAAAQQRLEQLRSTGTGRQP